MRHLFVAKSPKTGQLRQYEGLLELGMAGPYAIVSADEGDEESYSPEDDSYQELLREYKRVHPDP